MEVLGMVAEIQEEGVLSLAVEQVIQRNPLRLEVVVVSPGVVILEVMGMEIRAAGTQIAGVETEILMEVTMEAKLMEVITEEMGMGKVAAGEIQMGITKLEANLVT